MNAPGSGNWSEQDVMARIDALVTPAEVTALRDHRSGGSDGAGAAWLSHVVDAAVTLPLRAVPSDLSSSLRSMLGAARTRRRVDAVLLDDSRLRGELAGIRGPADHDPAAGYTLTFSAEAGNVVVDIWPNGEWFDLEAQLMATGPTAGFEMIVVPADTDRSGTDIDPSGSDAVVTVRSDRLGRAAVDDLRSGRHELVITHADVDTVIAFDLQETP